jgi:serine/threonine protein phosphatase PrpC
MKYSVFSAMLRGPRTGQEDCLLDGVDIFQADLVREEKEIDAGFLSLCVCDGMGGHDFGETASRFVCEQIQARFDRTCFSAHHVRSGLSEIQTASTRHLPANSGTTVAGLMMTDGRAIAFNAGDSRIYRILPQAIDYISHDHSLVQGLVDKSFIPEDKAGAHPLKNIINFGIGPLFRMEWGKDSVHIHEHAFSVDAAYLICTDGVNDLFTDSEIFDILMPMPARGGHRLLQALEEKGLKDNASFILLSAGA